MTEQEKSTISLTPLMLVNRISKRFRDLMRRTGERAGIPARYRDLLRHLAHKDGRTQHELADLAGLTPPTVSVTLRDMEQEGYVVRRPHETDQRITLVYLTDQGRATNEKMHAFADGYDKQIMHGITREDYETAHRVLIQMRENLNKIKEGDGIQCD